MNRVLVLLCIMVMGACNRKPFVDHKLKFEKISDDCSNLKPSFRMVSNIAGERYEFEKCLGSNFTKGMLKVSRQQDTVLVRFPEPGARAALYKISLDIDSYPVYNFITIDGETLSVGRSN